MPQAPSLTDVNNFFIQSINQFQMPIYNWVWITNPYIGLFNRAEFEPLEGLIPQVNTTTSEMPTEYPFDLSNLQLSDGTADSCDVQADTINYGYITRNYRLQTKAFETPIICLTDLQFDWQAAQTVGNLQKNLQQFATTWWSDWYRVQNIGMINNKITTLAAGAVDTAQNSNYDYSGLTLPTTQLSWDHLNPLYDVMAQLGGSLNAVGMSEGNPLYALGVGPGYKRALFQTDTKVRDTVNWGDAFQNFQARGINTSIYGFIPNLDLYPLRYESDGTTPIYPFLNYNVTKGRGFKINPDWYTPARGGIAVYEQFTILCKDIYEVRVRPVGPKQYANATFDSVLNYIGDFYWINNKDMDENILGNKGFYRLDMQVAAKPVRPEVGFTGITLALD